LRLGNININYPDLSQLTQVQALRLASQVASNARTGEYTRKYAAVHKMRHWERDLGAATGWVRECEKAMVALREEVEEAERNIGIIESGLVELEQRIRQAQDQEACEAESISDSGRSIFSSSCGALRVYAERELPLLSMTCLSKTRLHLYHDVPDYSGCWCCLPVDLSSKALFLTLSHYLRYEI
jgi:hypothetical protein